MKFLKVTFVYQTNLKRFKFRWGRLVYQYSLVLFIRMAIGQSHLFLKLSSGKLSYQYYHRRYWTHKLIVICYRVLTTAHKCVFKFVCPKGVHLKAIMDKLMISYLEKLVLRSVRSAKAIN